MSLNHPLKEQLIAFGQGKLAADESSSVEQHLEVCRECCETLLDLKDDTFVGLVKIAKPSDAVADAASVRTDPGADASCVGHDSAHSATLLVQSGEAVSVDELPAELREHPRYRIVELIGRGGMGNVYRAEHRLMSRPVAIKLINSQLIRQPQAVERFRREVQAAAKLTHPNIVTAYDAEQAGDVHFLVMEFVEGTDLASVVKHRGPMSVAEACECIRQAATGLQHAHERGMIHRDIKPHNLMLSAEGQVRILDFGLAGFVTESAFESSPVAPRQESRTSSDTDLRDQPSDTNPSAMRDRLSCRGATGLHLTTAGSVMGTPDYIAPEQVQDAHSADIRADIYSLGCTLHFLLTGKPPFEADNVLMKLKAHAEQSPPVLTTLRKDVPTELAAVVSRMMAKNPAERFQTPAAVAEALAPFANPAALPPKRRMRTMVAALCMGVAALLAGVIFVQTSKGRVEIQSEVDDVEIVIKRGGEQIDFFDTTTGSQIKWLPSGEYEIKLKGNRNDIEIKGGNFKLSRWGTAIVTLNRKPEGLAADQPLKSNVDAQKPASHKLSAGWGSFINTDGASDVRESDGRVTITVPAGDRTYWSKQGPGSVPRLMQEVDGDFVAQVKVTLGRDSDKSNLFSASLAVWNNDRDFHTLTFTLYASNDSLSAMRFLDGPRGVTSSGTSRKSRIAHLKIERRNNELTTSWSRDGETWEKSKEPVTVNWPRKVQVGVAVNNRSTDELRAQFEELTITKDAPPPPAATPEASDEQRLQGKWIAVAGHARKKPLTAAELTLLSITFDGERVEFVQPSGPPTPQAVTFTINSNRDPKQIDFVAPGKQESMPGIYQFDGERLKLALIDQDYSRPTNFDPDHRPDHLTATFQRVPVAATLGDEERKVLKAAEAFLVVADEDRFDQLHDISSTLAKRASTKEQFSKHYQLLRDTVGKATQRTLQRLWLIDEFPGLPAERYAAVEYKTKFANRERLLFESAVLNFDTDGQWRVNTYATTLEPLPIPGPKKTSGTKTSEKSQQPVSPIPPTAVPTGANLILDPSFENTGLTQLPRDWRAWLNDGQEFRCEVVAGGHTGQRCLLITGKGTRGVVFANDMKADRTKRYAIKGWAKFEGDKDARAIIKFNYFRGSEFLGVHDLVGVTADQPGWHLLEKTDTLDAYPQADHFYAMCHVEGSGTGWFDDLELIAYDRDKLPIDFDSRHGRHNRLTGPNSLERWGGAWETEYVFREFDNSPKETKLTMITASERTLGNYFLLSHAKKIPLASGAASAPRSGDKDTGGLTPPRSPGFNADERLLFLTFDQNLGAFRQWFFSSNGKAFEWRGPWDDATKSLELRMLPDASNLFSSERFVDADHIEAKLRFQYVMGMKDAGRWTATRKAAIAKVDVPIAKTHPAEPAELSQLNKFAGEWTIRATYKPSVWNPQQREETIRETSHWILGGRFLMTRAFNDQGQLTSMWLATYEPSEKSNHFWFFNADGSSGQWRLTWDASSRGFHFRSIDMPTGWIGTGFNRWINDDTFDNQALIKDENGRVLLDSTQERRRKK